MKKVIIILFLSLLATQIFSAEVKNRESSTFSNQQENNQNTVSKTGTDSYKKTQEETTASNKLKFQKEDVVKLLRLIYPVGLEMIFYFDKNPPDKIYRYGAEWELLEKEITIGGKERVYKKIRNID